MVPEVVNPNSAPGGSTEESSKPAKKPFRELFSRAELWHYGIAALIYIGLGVLLLNWMLNWIVGPLFIVLWIWFVPVLLDKWRARRS